MDEVSQGGRLDASRTELTLSELSAQTLTGDNQCTTDLTQRNTHKHHTKTHTHTHAGAYHLGIDPNRKLAHNERRVNMRVCAESAKRKLERWLWDGVGRGTAGRHQRRQRGMGMGLVEALLADSSGDNVG
jgi:hypothetical protein